jgi:hypothetical protein
MHFTSTWRWLLGRIERDINAMSRWRCRSESPQSLVIGFEKAKESPLIKGKSIAIELFISGT